MPITIKTGVLNYKDPTSGEYVGVDMISGTNSIIADEYSSQQTYLKDEYCIHECELYKAKQNISPAEAWTAVHWDKTTVAAELGSAGTISDVQVNGTSVVQDGVAEIPLASESDFGVIKLATIYATGLTLDASGYLKISGAAGSEIKTGISYVRPIVAAYQHESAFYGLAKAAGDTTQSQSANAVGTYTESAKSAISSMLNAPETVSGTAPTINAKAGVQYVCGEVATLDITCPASGTFDVVFESGSTATVLTVTPPTGMTLEWANDFDASSLEANAVYEINISVIGNRCLGVAASWT